MQKTERNPILDPTTDETLAVWAQATAAGPVSVRRVIGGIAQGHPAGMRHDGVKRHQANTTRMIRAGRLVQAGDDYGTPLYRVA